MKRTSFSLIALPVVATITLGAFYSRRGESGAALTTEAASPGSIVTAISSTGTLEAVTTVQVGSQVSGTIEALSADFNSIVRQGQVLAKLDQSTFTSALEQARASLLSAEADAERLRVAQSAADVALGRARELAAKQLLPAADLQTAETTAKTAAVQVVAADAKITQARSAVQQAQVSLAKTVIASPIDGVVIARNVDVGQTVAASLSAPTLFVIAADLAEMQVNANIDESDVGQIHDGQPVSFRVDAYPADMFEGRVKQVRLDPATVQNVVTYAAIIDAPNPALKLKPGMTANVTIEVARRDDVLRVPNAALRFKPDADVLSKFAAKGTAAAAKAPTVWVENGTTIVPVAVRLGASDASYTEIVDPPFAAGTLVVTRASSAAAAVAASRPSSTSGNPLMPSRPPGPRPPGL
jgi:HlyD family secretion protein